MRQFFLDLYKKHKQFQAQSDEVAEHLLVANFERLSFIGYIAIPVHLLHILLFWNFSGTRNEMMWRNGIILSHSVLLAFMVGLVGITRYVGERRTRKVMVFIIWATITVMLLAGVAIVAIDQLVTTNVTPFLIMCTITSMLFLLRPTQAMFVYITAYLLYAWGLGLTQTDQAVLLSNRVNGITAVGIAIALSVILWRSAVIAELQERALKRQKRELEEKNAKLREYAFFDGLTGLYNRKTSYELIKKSQEQMQRNGSSAIILLVDIDYFKRINDQYGHLVGDQVLEKLGKVLAAHFRKGDIVARWGGEEFLCCLFDVKLSYAHAIAEDLRRVISEIKVEGVAVAVTASIGVSVLDPKRGFDFEKAYQNADEALYVAKESGRNRVEIHRSVEETGHFFPSLILSENHLILH